MPVDVVAVRQNLRMFRGDTPTFELTVLNDDDTVFDITGYTIWFTAKNLADDADPGVFQLSTTSGDIIIINGPEGVAEITPPITATNTFTTDRTLYYDIQIRLAAISRTHTVAAGTLQVVRDFTRA